VVPEKQGLKLKIMAGRESKFTRLSSGSRKTRIETFFHHLLAQQDERLSSGSRKTRIETQ